MEEFAPSKRDKRRGNIASKVRYLNDTFEHQRDDYYEDMLHTLQSQLYALNSGTDPEYLEKVADLEEERDSRLTELYLWEQYQIEQAQKQFEEDTKTAVEQHEAMMKAVRQKLRTSLETQRKRLAEDRALLNIATDQSFLQSAANPTIPTSRSAAMAALSGPERRNIRRRDNVNLGSDLSGVSGTETGTSRRRAANGTSSAAAWNSDDSGLSGTNGATDRVELLKDLEHQRGRGAAKSYNGVKTLRNEDGLADLSQIAESAKRLRRRA